jgi:hypothetical protein
VRGKKITRSSKQARRVEVAKILKSSALSIWMKSWETIKEALDTVASTSSARPEKLQSEPQLSRRTIAWVWA